MKEDDEIKKAVDDIVRVLSSFEKWKQRVNQANQEDKGKYSLIANGQKWKHNNLVKDNAKKGRLFLGSLIRYSRNQNNYLPHVANHALAIENYLKEHPDLARNYGWDKPLVAQRYRIPGSERFIGIDEIKRRDEESNTDVQSGSVPPIKPPSTPPPSPPTSTPPPSPDNDDDGKNKAPKEWGVYKHNFTNLLEGFNPEDYKKKSGKDDKSLKAEKENTKGVNENTKALTGLRAYLGPYAKLAMPYYSARLVYQNAKEDTSSSLARVSRRTYGGIYGATPDRRGYRRMFRSMSSYGASESDIMREYAGQKKWASTLMFGMGLDKIEALAMVLGKAPGPAEMRDPELMQKWLRENMRGITDMQAMQLSAMGVASDTFIESARKGEATDVEGRAARIHSENKTLGEMATNPFRRLQYAIERDFAYDIAQGGMVGKVATGIQFGSFLFGSLWDAIANVLPGEKEVSLSDQNQLIPRQTSVTVNINGNIDSEERAHSVVEQIGAVVINAEK